MAARKRLDWFPVCAFPIADMAKCENFLVSKLLGFVHSERTNGGADPLTYSLCLRLVH